MANLIQCDGPGCGRQVPNDHVHLHRWIHVQEHLAYEDGTERPIDGIYCTYTCLHAAVQQKLVLPPTEERNGR